MAMPGLKSVTELTDAISTNSEFDAVVLVSHSTSFDGSDVISNALAAHQSTDKRLGSKVVLIPCADLAGGKLIHAATGPLTRDFDDVRTIADAAAEGVVLAVETGAVNPLLIIENGSSHSLFANAAAVSWLSVCQRLWMPLEAREFSGESIEPVQSVGIYDPNGQLNTDFLTATEEGRRVARDLCGTEPVRMAPPKFAAYCEQAFADTDIDVEIIDDQDLITREYPLLAAVGRASLTVPHHHIRVINLTYTPKGDINKTMMMVGKAVTYDTGGADIKVGGAMAGMSRDKGGGSAVAGLMKTVAMLKPTGTKVIASIAAVRNDIGPDAYVADEIITGHSGIRVRVGNTDAEGRMAMADMLSKQRQQALNEVNPEMFTFATLTGHAARAAGPYTIMTENGPARQQNIGNSIAATGDLWGDGFDVTRSRREDYAFIAPTSKAWDVLQSNPGPSVSIARGHQFPMAFLAIAAGLDKHGQFSEQPIPYTHVDLAGSALERGEPNARPLVAFAAHYFNS